MSGLLTDLLLRRSPMPSTLLFRAGPNSLTCQWHVAMFNKMRDDNLSSLTSMFLRARHTAYKLPGFPRLFRRSQQSTLVLAVLLDQGIDDLVRAVREDFGLRVPRRGLRRRDGQFGFDLLRES